MSPDAQENFKGTGTLPVITWHHRTYVQKIADGTHGFFAVCRTCSWMGDDRSQLVKAERDARRHGELEHIYPDLKSREPQRAHKKEGVR